VWQSKQTFRATCRNIITIHSVKDKALGRSIGQLKVKDSLFDETLGGTFVTAVIADHIVKTSKVDVSGNKRALGKVMSQAEKVKFILSANKDSPISIEGLDGDYDYSGCVLITSTNTIVAIISNIRRLSESFQFHICYFTVFPIE
jgi:molecular chaperone DnaK (HSP70)